MILLRWTLLLSTCLLSIPPAAYSAPVNQASIRAVDAVGMTVSDMDRSVGFYSKVLAFHKSSDVEVLGNDYEQLQGVFGLRMRVVRMRLGGEKIELTEYLTPQGRPFPLDSRSNNRWFQHIAIIVNDMEKAYRHLREHHVRHTSTAPQRLPDWNEAAGGIKAFYFKDPDGHALEILQFPPDKGDPKWRRENQELFMGIDHTAIVVSDTETSLKFYRDTLGLEIAGSSENYGPEQERLNMVFGARLRITALKAASGPGIEFFEYLTPGNGRPMPRDVKANDLIHWQTLLVTDDLDGVERVLRAGAYRLVSPGVVELKSADSGLGKAVLVRDPDGHTMLIKEKR